MTPPLIALAALAVAFFLPPPPCARAQEQRRMTDALSQPRRTAAAVLRLERLTMDAIRAKDAKALGRILADDFVYRTPDGELNRPDFLKNVTSLPGRILSVEGSNQRVSVYGETAVLTGVQHSVLRTEDGTEHRSTVAFTDIFVKRRGRWRLALAYGVELPADSARPARRQ